MPTITIRVSDDERARLNATANARGVTVSEIVREALALTEPTITARLDDHEQRLRAVERVAGME